MFAVLHIKQYLHIIIIYHSGIKERVNITIIYDYTKLTKKNVITIVEIQFKSSEASEIRSPPCIHTANFLYKYLFQ